MIKLLINFFIIFFFVSCESIKETEVSNILIEKKEIVEKKLKTKKENNKPKKNNLIFYYIGDSYFIEGVEYKPEENYSYSEIGLASFYGKELHNIKTINNDLNKVTELLARHKTLPLPSVVKITNLENGLSITAKIIDRHDDNTSVIQVSRKVAQLLGFYKNKLAKVRVDIVSDASKQWKTVTQSMNQTEFNETVDAAPTDIVSIISIDGESNENNNMTKNIEQPIEIGSESVEKNDLYLKIFNFKSYEEIKNVLKELEIIAKYTSESQGSDYNLIIGPITNNEFDKLVSSFIAKGYKKTELILE